MTNSYELKRRDSYLNNFPTKSYIVTPRQMLNIIFETANENAD